VIVTAFGTNHGTRRNVPFPRVADVVEEFGLYV
jgi:hypothetical protein